MALCFKSIPLDVCFKHPSSSAKDWLSLTDSLLADAAAVLAKDPKLNVEFVLDSGTCYYVRCGAGACIIMYGAVLVRAIRGGKDDWDENGRCGAVRCGIVLCFAILHCTFFLFFGGG